MSQSVKPATSVYLNYKLPHYDHNKVQNVILHNEVTIEKSHNETYFCVLQFAPAGYCGVQQAQSEHEKISIFSVWNGSKSKTKCIDFNTTAKVEKFGGEGDGLKCSKSLQWKIGETIGFTVMAKKVSESLFHISCHVEFRNDDIHMCTYEYNGDFPIQSMACFAEDWERSNGADGYLYERRAKFLNAYCVIDSVKHELHEVMFTKVENGSDAFGYDRCGGFVDGHGFVLFTGGEKVPKVYSNHIDLNIV